MSPRYVSAGGILEVPLLSAFSRRYRLDALALAALALLALAFFWRPLLSRGVWVPIGGGDMASFIYPMFAFAARSLASGTLPLWNPSVHAGMPFAADLQSGLFYPLNWPALLRGTAFGYRDLEAVVLIHYPLAGAFTYGFARELRLSRPAAWLVGAVFMLSGFMVTHLGHANMIQSAAWLPLQLWLLSRAVAGRGYGYAAGAGLVFALAFFAGHAQIVMLQLATAAAYVALAPLCWPALSRPSVPRRLAVLAVAGAVAFGAAALKILPGVELTRYSIRSDLPFERAVEFAAQPIGLATLLLPHLWGSNPTNYWGPWSNTEVLGYVGVLPLLLAGVAMVLRRERPVWFFAGLAVVALLLSLGDATALFGWVYRAVPGFDLVRAAGRYLYLFDFGVALAAGYGLDALRRFATPAGFADDLDRRALTWAARLVAGALLAVLGVALPLFLAQQIGDPNVNPRAVAAVSDAFFLAIYLAGALFLFGAALYRWLSPAAVVGLALAITTLDIASAYHTFNPTTADPLAGFRREAIVQRLRQDPGLYRIDSETGALSIWQPDTANVLGLQDAGGLHNPMKLQRYARFRDTVGRDYASPAYDLLGVRYLIAPDSLRLPADDFQLIEHEPDGLSLYRHLGALPRARVVYQAEAVPDGEAALARLAQPGFDPRQTVLVEGVPLAGAVAAPTEARIVAYGDNVVEIQADAAAEGYLVLADPMYPGWTATVDGREAPVVIAYGVFRAVRLAPGSHLVRFAFAPLTWEIGWRLSALTWALLALALVWRLRRGRIAPPGRGEAPAWSGAERPRGGGAHPGAEVAGVGSEPRPGP